MKNDWIVANLNNPDFTVSDFQNIADMSTSNTQMLSKDQYLKSDFIKSNEAFKDEQGRFSQKKFDDFYRLITGILDNIKNREELIDASKKAELKEDE